MIAADLLAAEAEIQAEGRAVLAELGLPGRLAAIGEPVLVGSAALGVMVRRDLDLTVACAALDKPAVIALGAELAGHQRVRQVEFRDDTGDWNNDPGYPDGLYLGVRCRASTGRDWTLDLWFVDEPGRQPDLTHLRTLAPRLDTEHRRRVLEIKTALAARGATGPSFPVYEAVLEHGIEGVARFDAWIIGRLPG